MPFPVPTLDDLRQQFRSAIAARLPGADLTLRFSNLGVSADVMAGAGWLQWQYLLWLQQQMFGDTAETGYLERKARIVGLQREAGAAAAGNVVFAGQPGAAIAAGVAVQTSNGSAVYTVSTAGVIGAGGTVSLPVLASAPGSAGNALAGALMVLVNAIAGVNAQATVDVSGITGGTDQESDASLRTRYLQRIQMPPQGGAAYDYIAWTKTVPGVTRVWVYPLNRGAGTVDVTAVFDGRTNIFPLAADLTDISAALSPLAPVTANVGTFALTAAPVNVTVSALTPNTTVVQAAVQAALAAFFATTTPAANWGDGVTPSSPGGKVWLTDLADAVKQAAGVQHFDLTAPTADVTAAAGTLPTLGALTFA